MEPLDQLPCAVLVTDSDGHVLASNEDLRALAASPSCTRVGASMDGLFSAPSRIFLQTHCWPLLLREGRLSEAFLQLRSVSGQVVPVLVNGRRGTYEGRESFYWTLFVASERQRFEAAVLDARQRAEDAARSLAISERFTRSVTDAIPGLVAYWDKDLRCRFANRAYLEWFGKGADVLVGSHLRDLLGGALYDEIELHIQAALRGEPQQFERLITKANGEVSHAWARYVPEVVDGVVLGFLAVVSDVTNLKQTEAALRVEMEGREAAHELLSHSSSALQQAQRLGHIGSWAWQLQGDVFSWSDELFRILGCDPAQGTPGYAAQAQLYLPESYARLQHVVQVALQTGEPYTLEMAYRRPDGVQGWVEARGEVVRDAQAQVSGLQGTVQDITERKRIETALVTESLRMANIIEATQVGTWEWNVQTGQVKLNQRSAAMLDYRLDELGDQTIELRQQNTHPDDHRQSVAAVKQHFAGLSEVYESEARMRHRDGHWVWILARGRVMTRTAAGEPEWMFGTHLDITQRKVHEEALRKNQDLLDRTGRLAGVGGWEFDVLAASFSLSDETRHLLGLSAADQPGLDVVVRCCSEDCRPALQAALERALATGEPWDLVLELQRSDGSSVWVHSVGAAVTQNQRIVRVGGALQDISERRRLDQRLAAKTAELKRSNEELERFAYVASHDLQEPLRMVTSYGQLLLRRHLADLKPEVQTFMHYMVDGGQRAQALIRDLLSLARLDSQAQPWQPLALNDAVADALKQLRLRVQETAAVVTVDELPTVMADARQIGQLMGNLLGNALKFRGDTPPEVHVFASREAGGWRISVRDNGIGIEPRHFERIFQMFQRLHLRSAYEGTGIGLTVCKQVVERHGGQIGVESTPGAGATFYFTLPDRAPTVQRTAESAGAGEPH